MNDIDNNTCKGKILVVGDDIPAGSIAVCFAKSGFRVTVWSQSAEISSIIEKHQKDLKDRHADIADWSVDVTDRAPDRDEVFFLAVIPASDEAYHKDRIRTLEEKSNGKMIIGVCTDYLSLSGYQQNSKYAENIIGMNWSEPAHTTFFLELVRNTTTRADIADRLCELGRTCLEKDPYIITGETGVRSKMVAAMAREAFFLIDNGYANVEDIDRACRNDAGTYMPFAGNFRYMDLMGTYAYGVVMKELNKELSNARELPVFFTKKISEGKYGMTAREGFYKYENSEKERWEDMFRTFSYEIRSLMEKYPFENWWDEVKEGIKSSTVSR